nr:hypothetical protein [Fodinibius sp.]NIX58255.1 hypothetical protein [candidate division Zixibacteria bacterium]NIY24240.1 hypothetical protein [Fodinibius sp.]
MSYLFSKRTLVQYFEQQKINLQAEVENSDPNYLLRVSESDFQEYLVSRYGLETPRLFGDQIYQHEPKDADISIKRDDPRFISMGPNAWLKPSHTKIRGTAITISIPFEGNAELFKYQPSTFTDIPPQGKIVNQEIQLMYQLIRPDVEELTRRYSQDLGKIKKYLSWVARDVAAFNQSLPQFAQDLITRRKQKLLEDRNMSAALGIPIKRREDAPRTYAVPSVRRKPMAERPKV